MPEHGSSSPQPTIEQRVLLLKPTELLQPTQWRRQRFTALERGDPPKDQTERQRLIHEIGVLAQRAGVLNRDANAPDITTIRQREAALRKELQNLERDRENPQARFLKRGIEIRLEVLKQRATQLPSVEPELPPISPTGPRVEPVSPSSAPRPVEATQPIRITLEDVSTEDLARTEAWVRTITMGYVALESGLSGPQKESFLRTISRRVSEQYRQIRAKYGTGNLSLDHPGTEGRDWALQTNPGMLSCQFASVGNALRGVGLYNPTRHSEQPLINALGGRAYADSHRDGTTIDDAVRALRTISPEIKTRASNSVADILQAVENGAAAVVFIDRNHVGTIMPGRRVYRERNGDIGIQVIDPARGIRYANIDSLIRSDITVADQPRFAPVIIIERPTSPKPIRVKPEPEVVTVSPRPTPSAPTSAARAETRRPAPVAPPRPERVTIAVPTSRPVEAVRPPVVAPPPPVARVETTAARAPEVARTSGDLITRVNENLSRNETHSEATPQEVLAYLRTLEFPAGARILNAQPRIVGRNLEINDGVMGVPGGEAKFSAILTVDPRGRIVLVEKPRINLPFHLKWMGGMVQGYLSDIDNVVRGQVNKRINQAYQVSTFALTGERLAMDFSRKAVPPPPRRRPLPPA
ncbi:hypothetical protein HYS93_03675 [Candidatus Daviesbacteria bacterium]|nr:hypothetical protein [Candidatus Daviesbacteria bacterium]